jgi:hypothetical protein
MDRLAPGQAGTRQAFAPGACAVFKGSAPWHNLGPTLALEWDGTPER